MAELLVGHEVEPTVKTVVRGDREYRIRVCAKCARQINRNVSSAGREFWVHRVFA
jgi:hypothetical protein